MQSFLAKIEHFFEDLFEGMFKKSHVILFFWFAVIFLGTVALLAALGFLPSELQVESNGNNFVEEGQRILNGSIQENSNQENPNQNQLPNNETIKNNSLVTGYGILPSRLVIPSIQLDTRVDNPISTSTKDLDYELTKGPVHYPGSGTIGYGNMFIFGHSTGWSIVQNRAYKVFNEIKNLKRGDVIYVDANSSAGSLNVKRYEYRVREIAEVNKNDTLITFDTSTNMLTLSTCDSFGAKTDRYVVTADFVGVK